MIPKKIHYCWFGKGEKSELINRCIASWKKYCPNYEIIEWNEENFDITSTLYTKQAYEAKKWAFVSDYVRLYALYTQGGLYFDTDVEVLQPLDVFLEHEMFTGFEAKDCPVTAVIGAEKGHKLILTLLDDYTGRTFLLPQGGYDLTTNTVTISKIFLKNGIKPNGKIQNNGGVVIYPQIVFCPNNLTRIWNLASSKSYTIHHFDQSWCVEKRKQDSIIFRIRRYIIGLLRNVIGTETVDKLSKLK